MNTEFSVTEREVREHLPEQFSFFAVVAVFKCENRMVDERECPLKGLENNLGLLQFHEPAPHIVLLLLDRLAGGHQVLLGHAPLGTQPAEVQELLVLPGEELFEFRGRHRLLLPLLRHYEWKLLYGQFCDTGGQLEGAQEADDLFLHVVLLDRAFRAESPRLPLLATTAVIGVPRSVAVRCVLGGYRRLASRAGDEATVGELVPARLRDVGLLPHPRLKALVLLPADERLVISLIGLAAGHHDARVERVMQHRIEDRAADQSSAEFSVLRDGQAPLASSALEDLRRRRPIGNELQAPLHDMCTERIRHLAMTLVLARQRAIRTLAQRHVSELGYGRPETPRKRALAASLDVLRHLDDVLVGAQELVPHRPEVVIVRIRLTRRRDLFDAPIDEQITNPTRVLQVTAEAVEVPAQDAVGLTALDGFNHLSEHRATGTFRRAALLENAHDLNAAALGEREDLALLIGNGHLLAVLAVL